MRKIITTFPNKEEFTKAKDYFDTLKLSYEIISPEPAYELVGVKALVIDSKTRALLPHDHINHFMCAGWVNYEEPKSRVPEIYPVEFENDIFGKSVIMALLPCIADERKMRFIAHISGNLTEVFPYLNTLMKGAEYNKNVPLLTFREEYRIITLYPNRISVAKADDIIDSWSILENIRCYANEVWRKKDQIEPSYETHKKTPAIEIYKYLPRNNCRLCGEKTCLAFALKLWSGDINIKECKPLFTENYKNLKELLFQTCTGIE